MSHLFATHRLTRAIALTLAAGSLTVQANNDSQPIVLEKLVVSAAGFEQKITDAPASISVITQEDLETKPYMTLLDAVRDLEGVDIGETRDKTGQGTISMRGMGSDYTLILVNGKRQNNHGDIYPNSFQGNQFNHIPPLDAIERIEVIRGPASTLYGADAMGGVINIITKKVTDSWTGSVTHSRTRQTDDAFGDDTTTDFNIMGPLIPGKLGLNVRGSLYNRDASSPELDSVVDPNGTVHTRSAGFGSGGKTVDNENRAIGASLTFTPTDNQTITLDYDKSDQEYNNRPMVGGGFPLGTVDSIDTIWKASGAGANRRANPNVGYIAEQEFSRESWALSHEGNWGWGNSLVSLAHIATSNDGRTMPFTVAERKHLLEMIDSVGPYAGLSEADRKAIAESTFLPRPKRTLESRQYTLDAKLDIPFELAGQHMVVVGTQIVRGELEDGVFGMESGTPGKIQDHNMWSIFVEDTWTIVDPFALTLGVRYDDHEVFGSEVSPRIYGVYTINPEWSIKGGVSTGFKTPKTTDLYDGITGFGSQGTSPFFGNPNLKPETSVSTELALYWQHPNHHNFNITVFQNTFEDKLASQPCGAGTAQPCATTGEYADLNYLPSANRTTNIDEVVIEGVEVAGRWQIVNSLSLRGNYTFTDSEQKSGANKGLPLGNSARHMANATLDWQITDRFNVFLSAEARSKRYRQLHAYTKERLYYKDYEVLHLGASLKASEAVTFNFRINNLLDEDFATYKTEFRDLNGNGVYDTGNVNVPGIGSVPEIMHLDDYNNVDKRRSYWLSVNVKF